MVTSPPRVSRDWPGATVVCIGGGPSLTREDVDAVRGRAKVIAINDAYALAPWADVLYAADGPWWRLHWPHVKDLPLQRVTIEGSAQWMPDDGGLMRLKNTGFHGLEPEPMGLRTGMNSGYQAINLAVHFGAARILLLGYDMGFRAGGPSHWFGEHPQPLRSTTHPSRFVPFFDTLVEPLQALGVSVINCSRETALLAFPRQTLADALAAVPTEAVAC